MRLKKKVNTYFRMELSTQDSGRAIKDTDMEFSNGLTVLSMKASGRTTRLMAKAFSIT